MTFGFLKRRKSRFVVATPPSGTGRGRSVGACKSQQSGPGVPGPTAYRASLGSPAEEEAVSSCATGCI